jgi:hypothetical protein
MKTTNLNADNQPSNLSGPISGSQSCPSRVVNLIVWLLLMGTSTEVRAQSSFKKILTGDIVNDVGNFDDRAWGDYNNDGFLDLFVCNAGPGQTNFLYRNNGNGTFTRITQGDPVADADYHIGSIWGDYDNDGNLDLLVSIGAEAPSARANRLFHNNGDLTFTAVSGGSLSNQFGFFGQGAWADYDNDGLLDLFVTGHGVHDSGGKNLLMHNNGDGTFTRITAGAVANDTSVGWCGQWVDYDNDGFVDLFIVNNNYNGGGGVNFLYHNNRDGTFSRVLTNTIARDSFANGALCCAWGDYDNDGFQDLFVAAYAGGERNRLYHNNGNGTFTKVLSGPMLVPPTGGYSLGCTWGDYDNDGYLDLFISNGDGRNALFHNNGDGTFTQVLNGALVTDGGPGFTCAICGWVDYDNDGFLDLLVSIYSDTGLTPSGKNLLYHNNGNSNAWLEVKCVGAVSNRSAIGAKVRVHATIGGKQFWQLREINTGAGHNSVPLVAHFGLGDATNADLVRIEWPSGTVQEFQNVPLRQIWTVTEPPRLSAYLTNGVASFLLKGGRGFQYDVQMSTNLVHWQPLCTVTVTNLNGVAPILGAGTPNVIQKFYRAVQH